MPDIIACICEGNAEKEIIELLLNANLLTFSKADLLEKEITRVRKADKFSNRYLNRDFGDSKISVYRILDSKSECFTISDAYQGKIRTIDNFYTCPEIELLVIITENHYAIYKRKFAHVKPSTYCKQTFGFSKIKNEGFITKYYVDTSKLVSALEQHRRYVKKRKEKTIFNLLK